MKLLIVTQKLDSEDPILGFFHRWVEEFAKHFETVTVLALSVGTYSVPANVRVHTLGKELEMERFSRTMRYLALLVRLRRDYTHVFAHMNPEYVIGGGFLWRILGKKIGFWYVHGAVTKRLRLAAFFAHRIFTASKESCRIDSRKVSVVGHGIDTALFAPSGSSHGPSLITTGRISPSKHLETVLKAYRLLKKRVPALTLTIAGSAGSPKDVAYAETVISEVRTAGAVVLPPLPNREIPELLSMSTVFMSASETGSLDKAVLEAMSCGVVPVTSNPAFKEMLSPHRLYVERTPEAFANRAEELFKNGAERSELAKRMREIITSRHSLPRLIAGLRNTYENL
jgi:glycosyltransferase involved in cell wall biosynthesis